MVGLSHANAENYFTLDDFGQPLLPLLLGAVFSNVGSDNVAAEARKNAVEAAFGVLFGLNYRVEVVTGATGTAILLVYPHGHKACLAHLFKVLVRDHVLFAPLVVIGHGFFVEKSAEGLTELIVLPLERELSFHCLPPC